MKMNSSKDEVWELQGTLQEIVNLLSVNYDPDLGGNEYLDSMNEENHNPEGLVTSKKTDQGKEFFIGNFRSEVKKFVRQAAEETGMRVRFCNPSCGTYGYRGAIIITDKRGIAEFWTVFERLQQGLAIHRVIRMSEQNSILKPRILDI
jgi:hypothetical protein